MYFISPFKIEYRNFKKLRFAKIPNLIPYSCKLDHFCFNLTTPFENVNIEDDSYVDITIEINEMELIERLDLEDSVSCESESLEFYSTFSNEQQKQEYLDKMYVFYGFLGHGTINTNLPIKNVIYKIIALVQENTNFEVKESYHSISFRENNNTCIQMWLNDGIHYSFVIEPDDTDEVISENDRIGLINSLVNENAKKMVNTISNLLEKERLLFLLEV